MEKIERERKIKSREWKCLCSQWVTHRTLPNLFLLQAVSRERERERERGGGGGEREKGGGGGSLRERERENEREREMAKV